MTDSSRRILKSGEVELNGQCRLGLLADESEGAGHDCIGAVTAAPEARILENYPDYAVIEVRCSCGARISLKCDYSARQRMESPQT